MAIDFFGEELICNGIRVVIKYLGVGRFEKFAIFINNQGVYYLEKDINKLPSSQDYKIYRREYFGETLVRKYRGWQNCFVEFCRHMAKQKKFPTTPEQISAIARELGLSKKIIKIYLDYYKKFFY